MQAEPQEWGPVVELSVMLNKHWGGELAQPSARDTHKSREGRAVQHVYNAEYMGKSKSTSLKAAENDQRTERGGQRLVFQLLLMLITTCRELQVLFVVQQTLKPLTVLGWGRLSPHPPEFFTIIYLTS